MIYRHPLRVPFQDIDAAGVVFFAHLFRYAHESYEAFMREIDQPLERLLAEGEILLPLVHAEADYHQPLRYAARLMLELSVEATGESSFTLAFRCLNAEGICHATIKTVHVVQNVQSRKKIEIPASLLAGLEPYRVSSTSD